MWNWLWILPPALLIWAIVLVIRNLRKVAKDEEKEDKPRTLDERLAELDAEENDQ